MVLGTLVGEAADFLNSKAKEQTAEVEAERQRRLPGGPRDPPDNELSAQANFEELERMIRSKS